MERRLEIRARGQVRKNGAYTYRPRQQLGRRRGRACRRSLRVRCREEGQQAGKDCAGHEGIEASFVRKLGALRTAVAVEAVGVLNFRKLPSAARQSFVSRWHRSAPQRWCCGVRSVHLQQETTSQEVASLSTSEVVLRRHEVEPSAESRFKG